MEDKYGDINSILFPIHRGILEFLGFSVLQPEITYSVERLTDEERKTLLDRWSKRLMNIEQEIMRN
nr:hypothetical protein [Chryseobacterium antibioticum]